MQEPSPSPSPLSPHRGARAPLRAGPARSSAPRDVASHRPRGHRHRDAGGPAIEFFVVAFAAVLALGLTLILASALVLY
jgi:hypothetical protein